MSFFLELQNNDATPIEKSIIKYIIDHPNSVIEMTMEEFARATYTSRSSISRFCKKIGYNGFNDLKIQLAIELNMFLKDTSSEETSLPFEKGDDTVTIIDKTVSQATYSILETMKTNPPEKFDKIIDRILHADNIVFLGVQFSGIVCYDAHIKFSKIGLPSKFFLTEGDILSYSFYANPKDIVFLISYSGTTSTILQAAEFIKRRDVFTVSITKNYSNPLLEYCNLNLYINSSDDPEMNLSLSSRIAMMTIIDTLYSILISRKSDSVYDKLVESNKIYKKHFGN